VILGQAGRFFHAYPDVAHSHYIWYGESKINAGYIRGTLQHGKPDPFIAGH
jgi:hypothetical protein